MGRTQTNEAELYKNKRKIFWRVRGRKEIADIEDFIKSKEDEIENIYKKMQLHENKIADLKDQLFSLKSEKTRTIDKLKESKIKVKRRNKQLKQKFEAEAKRTNAIKKKSTRENNILPKRK